MASREKAWVVSVWDTANGDKFIYGPYTERQARQTVMFAEVYYEDSDDYDGMDPPLVSCYRLNTWEES